ncbi:glycoside hydrolase/deacetylase [Neocallimastix lanati (nom. inval.)]|jgi:peptidoglycan/xylan/chitin deacetylase (PgdA/CDA1 family)|uniref:Glycoside hydrolase/deacetylase n=1 Tax=Neocallimastix californiae TaxID=1754190 RepID=A0A1Y1ZC90_9FUNG|nr:glycoside hydrolase/deacetylase [Neocallimastix sp. JGI-2020a]ORY07890.1 glycoside hydrolase/deacetylase [Neocallimastix californiae]|eukprot:ORY07890.1 glycoside hydrolase/deacetylase [Neocallimastix californiae]
MFRKFSVYTLLLTFYIVKICCKAIDSDSNTGVKAHVFTECLKPGQFVLTFDDGPNPDTTPIVLETLKKYDIKATFFINGINYGNLESDPRSIEIVKKTYAEGHDIGSHTYYHKDLFEAIKEGTMEINIDKLTNTINDIIGVKPAFFRPPCGNGGYEEKEPEKIEMTERIQKYLGEHGYNVIMWGTDTRDWDYKENVEKVISELNLQLKAPGVSPETNSFITLLHDVHPTTVNIVLPEVIGYIKKLGYTFVPLSECIGVSPYQGVALNKHNNSNNLNSNSLLSNPDNIINDTPTNDTPIDDISINSALNQSNINLDDATDNSLKEIKSGALNKYHQINVFSTIFFALIISLLL